jgi:hypothetical protein
MNYVTSTIVHSHSGGSTYVYYTVNNLSDKEIKYMVLSNMKSQYAYSHGSFTVPPRSMYVSPGYLLPSNVFVTEEEDEG